MSVICSEYVRKLESENWSFVLCIISLNPFTIQGQLFCLFILVLLCYRFSPNISSAPLSSMHIDIVNKGQVSKLAKVAFLVFPCLMCPQLACLLSRRVLCKWIACTDLSGFALKWVGMQETGRLFSLLPANCQNNFTLAVEDSSVFLSWPKLFLFFCFTMYFVEVQISPRSVLFFFFSLSL